ncbi:MAG: gamma-glutamyltransferase, partial [Saprospiraceae bacterium]
MFNNYYTKMGRLPILALFVSLAFLFGCQKAPQPPYTIVQSAQADSAMIVAGHPLAAKVGVEIMKAGGNAVDAAIAAQFALAVAHPRAGNIGGGGFMVIRMADGEKAALDYREEAPSAAHRDMYLDSLDEVIPDISREGHLAVGVPGSVAGMVAAFEKYSQLKDWKKLLQPAIDLANNGFVITQSEADRLNHYRDAFLKNNLDGKPFVIDGEWHMGDRLVQKDLARTLERIRDNGKAGFYEGETANLLVEEMKRGNGLITLEDLKNYEAKWKSPVEGDYKQYHVVTMPPSSSGGIALVQLLTILENYPLSDYGFQSLEAVHTIVEAERRVYADRAKYLGDDAYYPVPQDSLLDARYLAARMADFDPTVATLSDSVESGNFSVRVESFETTHTSVIDAAGNAVSVTTTLNLNYGSKVLVAGAGFFLND